MLDASPPAPVSWLAQFPAPQRSSLAELFYRVVRRGETSPPQIVEHAVTEIHRKLMWKTDPAQRQWWCQVLNTLSDDPQAAQVYAGEVLAAEQLPPAEKARLKAEKAKPYILGAMRGKEATPKQHGLLRALGYLGELPADRATASELIDALLRKGRL